MLRFVGVALLASVFFLTDLPAADACWNVRYKGLKKSSKRRKAVTRAIKKGDWKKARDVLLKERERATKRYDKNKYTKGREDRPEIKRRITFIWKNEVWAAYQLGMAHHVLGENKEAVLVLTSYLSRDARKMQVQQQLGAEHALLLSKAQFALGRGPLALDALQSEIKVNSKDARLYSQLGSVHEADGALEKAETALAKAVELDKNSHGGMEWIHLEVVRYRIQLRDAPKSAASKPFSKRLKRVTGDELEAALKFAEMIAPNLPIRDGVTKTKKAQSKKAQPKKARQPCAP